MSRSWSPELDESLSADQRRIAVHDDHIIRILLQGSPRAQDGVAGPEPLQLHEDARVGHELPHLICDVVPLRPDHDRDLGCSDRRHCRNDMADQRAIGDFVQDLRLVGPHPCALARRQYDGEAASGGVRCGR